MCRPGLRVLIATAQKKGEGGQRAVCSGSFAQPYLLVHLHMDGGRGPEWVDSRHSVWVGKT